MVNLDELLGQAKACHGAGRLGDAAALYRKILLAEPRHAETHYLLGTPCHALGRAQESIASLTQAVQLNPWFVEAHHYLGFVFGELKSWDEAIACYQQALRLAPDSGEVPVSTALMSIASTPAPGGRARFVHVPR